jgi:hypothetical protein
MFRDHRSPVDIVRELRLSRPEREAARAERRSERQMRRDRDNQHSAERRAAATQAEADRHKNQHPPG